ncbi:hypothetical protein Pcinc_014548 [Petrolisthes cinctipes]|uniref:Reverse transcriptase domain-containing protein n=1 Tax=Petrolisthes cinctipes TaxID=88211 RepID=A0AAE1FW78_PETCI|nr:hypothetical protein Pcinc_014548 [Petrolisthes cinctipes]
MKMDISHIMQNSNTNLEPFTEKDLTTAISHLKHGKASGLDGITPEMVKHLGVNGRGWLLSLLNKCATSLKIPKIWKRAKVVALLKPGKDPTSPKSYRPISLLCTIYKLYEHMILARILPPVEEHLSVDQAGFRPGCSCCSQVLNLTQYIEDGFENKQITGTVFVDLTAAYDTVNHRALIFKVAQIVQNSTMVRIIESLLSNRRFHVEMDGKKSRWYNKDNGLPQGSVLAPVLFNIYTNDQPQYPNIHRVLSFKEHVTKLKGKLGSRTSLLSKLTSTNWGADPKTLRHIALALYNSTGEYCAPVWARWCHAHKIDAELNKAYRIITGVLKSTPLPALYRITGIPPPYIPCKTITKVERHKQLNNPRHSLFGHQEVRQRLKSRKSFTSVEATDPSQAASHRRECWQEYDNGQHNEALPDPEEKLPPGSNLRRKEWATLTLLLRR